MLIKKKNHIVSIDDLLEESNDVTEEKNKEVKKPIRRRKRKTNK